MYSKNSTGTPAISFSIRIPVEPYQTLDEYSRQNGISKNFILNKALAEYLVKKKDQIGDEEDFA